MKDLRVYLLLVVTTLLLSACDDSNDAIGYDALSSAPRLLHFSMVDSYGTDSEFDTNTPLAISPYIYNGAFDLYWDVISDYDYELNVRINSVASVEGSQVIASDYCSPGFPCHSYQQLFCRYRLDFTIICESSLDDVHIANIYPWINIIPKTLYFIVEACDGYSDYCEYQTIPVLME